MQAPSHVNQNHMPSDTHQSIFCLVFYFVHYIVLSITSDAEAPRFDHHGESVESDLNHSESVLTDR